MTFAFKTDGKEYPSFFGSTAAVKQLDANTWETTTRMKGQVLSVDTTKISADGKILTEVGTAVLTGEKITEVYDRQ